MQVVVGSGEGKGGSSSFHSGSAYLRDKRNSNGRVLPLESEDQAAPWDLVVYISFYPLLPCHLDKQLLKGDPGCLSCCLAWVAFPTALTLLLFLHAVLGGQSKSKYTCKAPRVSLHLSQESPLPASPCLREASLCRVELAGTGQWCG